MIEDAVIINFLLSLFFIMLIFYLDRFEQESLWSMTRVFFLAILATYGFTVLKLKIGGNQPFSPLVSAYIEAGFFEELLKFGLLALVIFLFKEVDEPFGLVLYAGLIALGFSFFENIGYFLRATQLGSLWEAQTRDSSLYNQQLLAILAARITPSHLLFDLPAVYFIGRSERIRWRNLGWAFAVALLLHGTWNYLAFLQEIWFIPYVFLLTMAACASVVFLSSRSRYERRHRMLDSLIEHNIYMLRQGRTRLSEDREARLLEKFREVKRRLQAQKFLRGYEQERVARRLHDVLPVPISDYLSGPGQAEARLEQALEGLKALPLRRFDWSYYAGLAILLFSAAFFAFLIINFLNHFLLG